jgi:ATP-dependent helicase HepA
MWKPGDRLSHRHNRELGPGLVLSVAARRLTVLFPQQGETLQFSADSDALLPLVLKAGSRARVEGSGEEVVVAEIDGVTCRLEDGRQLAVTDLWPLPPEETLVDRLVRGKVDPWEDLRNRLDGLRLLRLRQAGGLASFLGGRIRLHPHQLHVAQRAARLLEQGRTVRFLLADEVGLGKTVEACLIMNRLLHGGFPGKKVERTLIVAPDTLVVQWLGELWRKHHTIFVLIDEPRLADLQRDYGPGSNPFEIHRRAIVSLETFAENRRLQEHAEAAGIDLLIVDEAHHLRRPVGHPGNPAYRAIRRIADLGRHVLLLTATPLEDDSHGFFRLLQLLLPAELPEDDFTLRLAERRELPPCTSATRRVDIGGLPPRFGRPTLLAEEAWAPFETILEKLRWLPTDSPGSRKRKAEWLQRALGSNAALLPLVGDDAELKAQLKAAQAVDPRVRFLLEEAPGWRRRQEKTLIFVAHKESLDFVRAELEKRVQTGVFHEELSAERRDIEVAQFRLADGPAILVSTEAGGEGRNFEFCHRLVLFDLPWNAAAVEQRIGRLDRIGRKLPTEILYFKPPSGFARLLASLYEEIGLFEEPLGGLVQELRQLSREIEKVAVDGGEATGEAAVEVFRPVLEEARSARGRVHDAAYHELHRERYERHLGEEILAKVPSELEAVTEDVVTRSAARFGFQVEEQSGRRVWHIEYGGEALIDHLPGVMPGSVFRGTFDREEAVEEETLDFFASGHPLVEGILAELEEGPRGRVAMLQVPGDREEFGLLAILKKAGGGESGALLDDGDYELLALDSQGRPRPDLAALFGSRSFESEGVEMKQWTSQPSWPKGIRRMAQALPEGREQLALAAFRIRRR